MIGYRDVKKLKYRAREIAMMMTNEEIVSWFSGKWNLAAIAK